MDIAKPHTRTQPLTSREQEIMSMLLDGKSPKEIASSLNISYDTVLGHQKNLYRKLDIHSIQELFAKYSVKNETVSQTSTEKTTASIKTRLLSPKFLIPACIIFSVLLILFLLIWFDFKKKETRETPAQSIPAVFSNWITYNDNLGSHISFIEKIEKMREQYFETYTIAGKLHPNGIAYTGASAFPDPSTLEAMKKMAYFSFTFLGDGNTYNVVIATSDTRLEEPNNHYRKVFTAKKDEVSTITVNLNDLAQAPYGKPVPFVKNNIEFFEISAYSTGEFNLKIWDVNFFH